MHIVLTLARATVITIRENASAVVVVSTLVVAGQAELCDNALTDRSATCETSEWPPRSQPDCKMAMETKE